MKKQFVKPPKHGRVVDGVLYKGGKAVVKFFQHDGYGLNVNDLHEVNGVLLDTKYDGRLYAPVSVLREHGIPHDFEGEQQLILPVKFWRVIS